MRNADVDAMVLDWIQTLRKRSQAPVRVPRSRAQTRKRKAKRKAGRKGRRGKKK